MTSKRWPAHTYLEDHDLAMVLPNPCCMHVHDLRARNMSLGAPSATAKSIPIPNARYNTVLYCIFASIPESTCVLRLVLDYYRNNRLTLYPQNVRYGKIPEKEVFEKKTQEIAIGVENMHLSLRLQVNEIEDGLRLLNRQRACIWAVIRATFTVRLSGSHGPCFPCF